MNTSVSSLTVVEESTISSDEQRRLRERQLGNVSHYAAFDTNDTQLLLLKVYRGRALIGLSPVARTHKHPTASLLRPESRWWLSPLLAVSPCKTTCVLDTAFLGYAHRSPFLCADSTDRQVVRASVIRHLRSMSDVEAIWIAEPAADFDPVAVRGFSCFNTLPMVDVQLTDLGSYDDYSATLTKKRRRNIRQAAEAFRTVGAIIEVLDSPIDPVTKQQMYRCLTESAARATIRPPYQSLLNHEQAFLSQSQIAVVARSRSDMIGFTSFLDDGDRLLQCHGGLDYQQSLAGMAYHNLLQASIRFAIERGYPRISFGPLNNETKRRAGNRLMPVIASLWLRQPLFNWLVHLLVKRYLQVYVGPHSLSSSERSSSSSKSMSSQVGQS